MIQTLYIDIFKKLSIFLECQLLCTELPTPSEFCHEKYVIIWQIYPTDKNH